MHAIDTTIDLLRATAAGQRDDHSREESSLHAINTTIDQLLGYIEKQRAVSFDQVYEYMLREKLRLGAATNPIDVLDLAAYDTGRIDVDYDQRMIYTRSPARRAAAAATDSAPRLGPRR
jgi:hypothetical protein